MNTLETWWPVIEALGWTLIHFIWQGAFVALLLAILLRMLRRRSSNARYAIACVALSLMLVLPMTTMTTISLSTLAKISVGPLSLFVAQPAPQPLPVEIEQTSMSTQKDIVTASPWLWLSIRSANIVPLLPWMILLWLLGVIFFSLRLVGGWLYTRRLKSYGTRSLGEQWGQALHRLCRQLRVTRPVLLLESALVKVPMAVGWLRPVILLPASALTGLTPQQLEAIIAHELAHIRRHDYLVNLMQAVVETLLFYHPAVWWVSRRIRQEREHCCDDLAVAACGDVLTYARALLEMEQLRAAEPQLAMAANGGLLMNRIQRLVGAQPQHTNRFAGLIAGVIALIAVIGVGVGAQGLLSSSYEVNSNIGRRTATETELIKEQPNHTDAMLNDGDNQRGGESSPANQAASELGRPMNLQALATPVERGDTGVTDVNLQIENPEGAPLTILAATAKVSNLKSDQDESDDYAIKPSVTVSNNSQRRVIAFVLNIKNTKSNFEYDTGRQADINPGSAFSGSLRSIVGLPGDPSYLKIKVVGVGFEDGSNWGWTRTMIHFALFGGPPSVTGVRGGGPVAALPSEATAAPSAESESEARARLLRRQPLNVIQAASTESEPQVAAISGATGARARAGGGPVAALPSAATASSRTKSAQQARNLPYFMYGNSKMIRLGGGSLHNQAIKRVNPSLPPGASTGRVVVEVIVAEEGNVESARITSGQPFGVVTSDDPSLKNAALEAARQWRFKPEIVEGFPVKIIGELFFNFR